MPSHASRRLTAARNLSAASGARRAYLVDAAQHVAEPVAELRAVHSVMIGLARHSRLRRHSEKPPPRRRHTVLGASRVQSGRFDYIGGNAYPALVAQREIEPRRVVGSRAVLKYIRAVGSAAFCVEYTEPKLCVRVAAVSRKRVQPPRELAVAFYAVQPELVKIPEIEGSLGVAALGRFLCEFDRVSSVGRRIPQERLGVAELSLGRFPVLFQLFQQLRRVLLVKIVELLGLGGVDKIDVLAAVSRSQRGIRITPAAVNERLRAGILSQPRHQRGCHYHAQRRYRARDRRRDGEPTVRSYRKRGAVNGCRYKAACRDRERGVYRYVRMIERQRVRSELYDKGYKPRTSHRHGDCARCARVSGLARQSYQRQLGCCAKHQRDIRIEDQSHCAQCRYLRYLTLE